MTLDIFRIDTEDPTKSAYRGQIEIIKVEPKRSIGRLILTTGASRRDVKAGDTVGVLELSDE